MYLSVKYEARAVSGLAVNLNFNLVWGGHSDSVETQANCLTRSEPPFQARLNQNQLIDSWFQIQGAYTEWE